MAKRILIIGGYGNCGSYIARELAKEDDVQLIIAGRDPEKARAFAQQLSAANKPQSAKLDIHDGLASELFSIKPFIVIHTAGPYHDQGYQVASACMEIGAHYIDLADARGFVAGLQTLNNAADDKGVMLFSGVSTTPGLTSAVIQQCRSQFKTLESIDCYIHLAQKSLLTPAALASVLGAIGKPFDRVSDNRSERVYGWQNIRLRKFNGLGWRLSGNFDTTDLSLLPQQYPNLRSAHFSIGVDVKLTHLVLLLLSWFCRFPLLRSPEKITAHLLRLLRPLNRFSGDSHSLVVQLSGKDETDEDKTVSFELTSRSGVCNPIACIPAIALTRKLVRGDIEKTGAHLCTDFLSLKDCLDALDSNTSRWKLTRVK